MTMNLFISYSSKSREAVEHLATDLHDLGYTVWFDRELTGGHQWWGAILGQIRDCDVFIFALTPESLESDPCELEWKYARDCHKRILPIQLGDISMAVVPAGLQEIQLVDYRERGMSQLAALNRSIVKLPPPKPLPNPLPLEPETPLSPLVRFGEQIDAPSLSADEQILLVAKLRPFIEDTSTREDAQALLKRLRRRDDLLARTAEEIGRLLGEITRVKLATVATVSPFIEVPHPKAVLDCTFTPNDPRSIYSVCSDKVTRSWRLYYERSADLSEDTDHNYKIEYQYIGKTEIVQCVSISLDAEFCLVGGDSGFAHLWAINDLERFAFIPHGAPINGVAFSHNTRLIMTAGEDGKVKVWETLADYPLKVLEHGGKLRDVATSPIDNYAVSCGTDSVIRLWVINYAAELRRLEGHTSSVNSVSFSPNGRHILSGSSDWTVRLWDAATGNEIRQFLGHSGRVSSVAFAPNGQYVVSAAADKRAILWDLETGEEVFHFLGHTDRINSVAFSPDGKYIVTASHDKTARVWETGL